MSGRRSPYVGGDHRTRAARAQGYPARSVFKLEEIDSKYHLLRAGHAVVDLGAAPGSWSLYVSRVIGPSGRLLAVDLQAIEQRFEPHVTVVQGDALDLDQGVLQPHAPFDCVLSDMAPNTGANKAQNAARSYLLFSQALAVAERYGLDGSSFCGKLFMGADFEQARADVAALYSSVKIAKPRGTRGSSVEVFLIGLGRRAC